MFNVATRKTATLESLRANGVRDEMRDTMCVIDSDLWPAVTAGQELQETMKLCTVDKKKRSGCMESCQWIQVRCEQGHGVDYDAQYYDIVQMGGNEVRVEWNAWGSDD